MKPNHSNDFRCVPVCQQTMSLTKHYSWISYSLSGVLHGGLLLTLVLAAVSSRRPPTAVDDVDTTVARSPASESSFPAPVPADEEEVIDNDPSSVALDALADVDASEDGAADFVRRQLQKARQEAEARSAPEQVDELEALADRLTSVSSAESLEQLSKSIAPWIGSRSERATEPDDTADPSVPFDVMTAQISDVLKQEADGTIEYTAVMVDAAGRTQQTPLDAADGESLYDVFQLMKKFPLLKTVYQKTVMGLLDRLLEEERASANESSPPDEAGHAEQQDEK